MILEPPESVQKLQAALQAKAKGAPGYRFYLLYDKLYRKDVLAYAYRCCRANAGAPGVDGQDFADIEKYGEDRWLGELADTLRRKTYRAEAVRRVWIPKADGKKLRPLGIPCVADRVVMSAAVVVLGAIFEVDMPAEQHGYRANFSAHTAVRSVYTNLTGGPVFGSRRVIPPGVIHRKPLLLAGFGKHLNLASPHFRCNSGRSGSVRYGSKASPMSPTCSEHTCASRPYSNVALEEGSELIRSRRQLSATATDNVKVEAHYRIDQLAHHHLSVAARWHPE
jgi:hypothetical protein